MPLSAGARLGPYEILSKLGEGGMGEVYRARDGKLGRDVALKVLSKSFVADPDRLARFEREAQILASLNHVNIAAIYGFEESNGAGAIVMELVNGLTLAERIRQLGRGLPVADALAIAKQMADALEAAHERGVIHRDLKPANVKVTPEGLVKVLDFGLAKAAQVDGLSADASHSPTLTVRATLAGVVIGTAAYMSPEQARGRAVDKRADVWAFGCVLYELLTGRRAFDADDVSATMAYVITREPDWSALPADTPDSIRRLLRRCLEKDVRRRLADIADARLEIEEALAAPAGVAPPDRQSPSTPAWARVAIYAAVAAAAAAASGAGVWILNRPSPPAVTRTMIEARVPREVTLNRVDRNIAITPDGSRVVYIGNNATQIFVRALDALEPVAIARSSGARGVFVSPDGKWVGFVESTSLKKVAITGGPSTEVTRIDGVGPRGAAWMSDGSIIFATAAQATGLQRVSADGGTPAVLTRPDRSKGEDDHLWPEALPGGRAVLFTIWPSGGDLKGMQVAVLDLATGQYRVLVRGGGHAQYLTGGHLAYMGADGSLRAVAFDLDRLEVRGESATVVPRLLATASGGGSFAVANDGTLVYLDAGIGSVQASTPVWLDRSGKEDFAHAPSAGNAPRLSPDGTRVALQKDGDIWLWDLRRSTFTRLSLNGGLSPVWTPDGSRVVFASAQDGGVLNLWWQTVDSSRPAERLTKSENVQAPTSISSDGATLVFMEVSPSTGLDVMQLSLGGDRRAVPLVHSRFAERDGAISPDGRWLAYDSDSSGRFEVYVRPFPSLDKEWIVSTSGGGMPWWRADTRELYYVSGDGGLMRSGIFPGPSWMADAPVKLFDAQYVRSPGGIPTRTYELDRAGQRFLMVKESAPLDPSLVVVQHWDQEVERLVH